MARLGMVRSAVAGLGRFGKTVRGWLGKAWIWLTGKRRIQREEEREMSDDKVPSGWPPGKSEGQGVLSVMGVEGHATIAWDLRDYDSITHAKKMFDKLTKEDGFQAFSVDRGEGHSAEKGGRITKFDPSLCEIIMVPKVSGG
jgi:hypothetical protein